MAGLGGRFVDSVLRDTWSRLKFGALFGSGTALLLVGMVVAARTVHVLVAVLLRPDRVGLLATAALGVPSAVVSTGLAQGVLAAAHAAAIVAAVVASIAVAAGEALLTRRDAPPVAIRSRASRPLTTRSTNSQLALTCTEDTRRRAEGNMR